MHNLRRCKIIRVHVKDKNIEKAMRAMKKNFKGRVFSKK